MKIPFIKSRFTKIIQPNQFGYIPRYYDPVKADLEERVKDIKAEHGITDEETSDEKNRELEIRAKFKKRVEQSRVSNGVMSSSVRIIVILGSILVLGYFLFSNLDGILRVLLK